MELEHGLHKELARAMKGEEPDYTDRDPTADALRRLWEREDDIETKEDPEGPVRLKLGYGHD